MIAGAVPRGASVADRLRRARERRFVGREAELEVVREALAATDPSFAVVFVHGPGGVGKSALLRALEDRVRSGGTDVARVDLRAIDATPPAFCAALGGQLGRAEEQVRRGELGAGRCLLLIDTYENGGALDGWLRETFIPSTPAGTVTVIAGRERPGRGWQADPGWRELLRVVALRNLPPDDARALLVAEGVAAERHDGLLALTHGHPLALSLLIDGLRQSDAAPDVLLEQPDVVRTLLDRFVAGVPTPRGGRRWRRARTLARPRRACSATRSRSTTRASCSTGCATCRSSSEAGAGCSRTTSPAPR